MLKFHPSIFMIARPSLHNHAILQGGTGSLLLVGLIQRDMISNISPNIESGKCMLQQVFYFQEREVELYVISMDIR